MRSVTVTLAVLSRPCGCTWPECRSISTCTIRRPSSSGASAPRYRPGEDAERRAQCAFGDDREDGGLAPHRIDVGPVVIRRDQRALLRRLEPVPVNMPDLRPDPAEYRPGDLPVGLVRCDSHGHVVAAELWIVVQGLAVHVHDEAVADRVDRIAFRRLQHAGTIDVHVTLRIAQDCEDRRRVSLDRALDLDPLARHARIVSGGGYLGARCWRIVPRGLTLQHKVL